MESPAKTKLSDYPYLVTVIEKEAYIAGALRDGYVGKYTDNHGKIHYVITVYNKDVYWLHQLAEFFETIYGVKPKLNITPNRTPYLRLYSRTLVQYFAEKFGHPIGKQTNWGTPMFIKQSYDENLWISYIAGYFDAEGGIDINRRQIKFHTSWDGDTCPPLMDIKIALARFFEIRTGEVCMYRNDKGNIPRFVLRILKADNERFFKTFPFLNKIKIQRLLKIMPERSQPQDSSPAEEGGPEN
ncbi:homing endonuclease [Candidatus Caldarchaeum subterraneum]|uniref:Homing endonuclease n=1 Tax=Caldiarchaeum subterraneum TaxID=311458 RepID=E6N820_CALS0|nr:homing endonuclease [Candidatus Caldarchaeum subterraneum]BAJ51199.1 homing endonuclease [Candidatus Caldarchaeum subterraneum]